MVGSYFPWAAIDVMLGWYNLFIFCYVCTPSYALCISESKDQILSNTN